RALTASGRNQVVRCFEKAVVNFCGLDEVHDVDGPCLFERRRLEIVLGDDDEAAFLVLVALDEIFPGHGVPVTLAHPLEPHRRLVARVEHAEMRPVIAGGRVQLDRDVHEPERERALPESTHVYSRLFRSFSAWTQSSTSRPCSWPLWR